MAYQTGVSNDVDDLLDKLRVFAISLGWTVNRWSDLASGKQLCLYHADAGYFNFWSDRTESAWNAANPAPRIYCRGSTGFSSAANVDTQPGTSVNSGTNGLWGPHKAYHFFGTTEYLHVVVEVDTAVFAHFGCGMLDKPWNYTGGQYHYGTSWYFAQSYCNSLNDYCGAPFDSSTYWASYDTQIRCDVEGVSPYWFSNNTYGGISDGEFYGGYATGSADCPLGSWVNHFTPNYFNGMAPLTPIVNAIRAKGTKRYIVGQPKDMRMVMIDNYNPGQIVTYGTDDWMIFPIKRKNLQSVPNTEAYSGRYGLAYRKFA